LLGNQKKDGLLGETTVSESVVPAGESADELTFSIISSAIEPIDSVRSRKITVTSSGPTSLSSSTLADSPVGKVEATLTTSIVSPETGAMGGINTIDDTIVPVDSARSRRETVSVDGYPQITTYEFDDALGVPIIIEREVIPHSTPFEQKNLLIESQDRQIDKWKTLRITSRLSSIPPTRQEYGTQQFTFPAILLGVVVSDLNVGFGRIPITADETKYATGINKFVSVTPRLKPALSLPTRIRYVTSFHYGAPPEPESIYQITTQFISYSGTLFSFNFGNVLTNGFTIGPIQANRNDTRYSGLNETITFAASIPTASGYRTGQEVVISSEVKYYRSNLWVKRTGYVTLA